MKTQEQSRTDLLGLPLDKQGWPKEYKALAVMSYSFVTKEHFLHSIDTTQRMADVHIKLVQEEYRLKEERARVWIETLTMNHAFAAGFKL